MPDVPVDPQPGTQRPTKEVAPQPAVVESIPFWQSTQMRWGLGVVAASLVGILHKLCTVFHICVLQNLDVSDATFLLFNLVSFAGGLYWVLKRIKVGKDVTNTSAPISLK